jgi:hypothetical protein
MLAFNLGVFFRNLRGQPVVFSARRGGMELCFVGGVRGLHERTDLSSCLSVELGQDDLAIQVSFEEGEEAEGEDEPDVHVTLLRIGQAQPLFQGTFAFDDVRLQPLEAEVPTAHGDSAEPAP